MTSPRPPVTATDPAETSPRPPVTATDPPASAGPRTAGRGPSRDAQSSAWDPMGEDALARAAWSRIAEPADPAACALVEALGAVGALEWLMNEAHGADGSLRPAPRPPIAPTTDAWRASAAWATAAARWSPRLAGLDIRRELDVLERLGGSLIIPTDPWWPAGLSDLEQPPHCLWVRGNPALLAHGQQSVPQESQGGVQPGAGKTLALVGARASTPYGERVAADMAEALTAQGVLVISGGAFGIDAATHRGALHAGPTVAVSAGGVDRLYPAGNADLLEAVIANGALAAEVPPGCQPGRHRFLTRNRLIAALGDGTVVVEAAWRSGALSTARHARDLGRPLGAVPGPVTSMASAGCHRLLRDGAVCITDAQEAIELICPVGSVDPDSAKAADARRAGTGLLDGVDGPAAAVLDAMPARGSARLDSLARSAGLSEAEVAAALGLLELAGRVAKDGARWRRRGA